MASGYRVVVGLDYGTNFTRVAYSESSGTLWDIQLITDWPGPFSHTVKEKVPSQVAYGQFEDSPYSWGTWGYLIPPTAPRQCWTKLQLDARSKTLQELQILLACLSNDSRSLNLDNKKDDGGPPASPGREPVEIVTDYLTGIKDHVLDNLRIDCGSTLFEKLVLDVVLTIPAVWSDKAKDLMFQAVTRSGFVGDKGRIKMITEPEAAATYTLKAGVMRGDIKVVSPITRIGDVDVKATSVA
ncbi:MAG: hypothetical protein M1839_000507 [Geoglossum umbratile]|nr:MAG: hypothetical protein M1839_000507 [Geoglossum umbratile]